MALNQANLIPTCPGWTGYWLCSVNDQFCLLYSLLKRSVFIPFPKKGNGKECSSYCTIALISQASKAMLKILHARLQQYMNRELLDVQTGFRKGRGTRDQIANICWIMEKAREFQKNIYFCLLTMPKLLTVWITTNCGKFLKRWEYQITVLPPEKSVCRSRSNS